MRLKPSSESPAPAEWTPWSSACPSDEEAHHRSLSRPTTAHGLAFDPGGLSGAPSRIMPMAQNLNPGMSVGMSECREVRIVWLTVEHNEKLSLGYVKVRDMGFFLSSK